MLNRIARQKKDFIMNRRKAILATIAAVAFAGVSTFWISGCTKVNSPSLYDPNQKFLPDPVVDSLSPSGSALAGIDTITIYGKNFIANKDSDQISFLNYTTNKSAYFGYGNSAILSASTTKLIVKAPAVSGDTIQVRVSVTGAIDFSKVYNYKLIAAIVPFTDLPTSTGNDAYGVCAGDSNIYVSVSNTVVSPAADLGIFEVASDGTIPSSPYAQGVTGKLGWPIIKFGPGGYIYADKGFGIYRMGNPSATVWARVPTGTLTDFDFDEHQNMWVGWSSTAPAYGLYRVAANASTKEFPLTAAVSSVRFYNGYLYFALPGRTARTRFTVPR